MNDNVSEKITISVPSTGLIARWQSRKLGSDLVSCIENGGCGKSVRSHMTMDLFATAVAWAMRVAFLAGEGSISFL